MARRFFIQLIGVRDSPRGPIDGDAIDGEELVLRVTDDGQLLVRNGAVSMFGDSPMTFTLEDIVASSAGRIEIRILDTEA